MGEFFVYILKASACLSVFYLFYRLLLSRETFHRFNRMAVLGILVISLLIPFCQVSIEKQTEVQETVLTIEQLLLLADLVNEAPVASTQKTTAVWVQVVLLIYLAGIFFFICRNLYSLVRLCLLLKSGERQKVGEKYTLIIHDRKGIAPFSWMGYVVISRKDLTENGREILIHELAHIRKRHSVDLLIADICIFFQWFNPAAWLLKQELQNIHEYEADETVIKEGVDAKHYQLLIIKKAVGTRLYSMANSFNHSKLKKRITMMLKEKSSPWARLKYLYVLPITAIAISAFARPEISNELKEISEVKVNNLTAIVKANETEKHLQNSELLKDNTVNSGYENAQSTLEEVNYDTASRTVIPDVAVNNPEREGEQMVSHEVAERMIILPADTLLHTEGKIINIKTTEDKSPLFIVDGKETSHLVIGALNPHHIKSIEVLKDKSAVDMYGKKAENGVVIIHLKEEDTTSKIARRSNIRVRGTSFPNDIMILLDGKETTEDKVNAETIESVTVLKNKDGKGYDLVEMYGDKAKNGIILITSKRTSQGVKSSENNGKETGNKIMVEGIVKDSAGKPIMGAVVSIIGTNNGTITDAEGKFRMEADKEDFLSIVYIGMKKAVAVANPTVAVILEDDPVENE